MSWRGAAREDLDNDHATATAWTSRLVTTGRCIGWVVAGRLCGEQLSRTCDVVGAGRLGEQAVVADAVEAVRQDVNEEATDELVCCERHVLVSLTAFASIVLPFEGDTVPVECDQAGVG